MSEEKKIRLKVKISKKLSWGKKSLNIIMKKKVF